MKAIIAQYFKTEKRAVKRVLELKEMWKGKLAWYVICVPNGYFVVSETQARKCGYLTSYKDRRYGVKNTKGL